MADATAAAPRRVLVLYVPVDEPFVRGFLLPALGPSAHGEPAIDARDLAATEVAALDEALVAGGVAIAVITPAFLTDPWARQSELLASGAAVDGKLEVVPLWLEDCALPPHIRYKVLLDFRDRGTWDKLARTLRDYLARPVPVEPPLPCPYPGMRPFQADDAKYFYGRDAEIDAVLALIAAGEREIYLIGPSGSGKSSLISAGVLPRLAAQAGAPERVVRTMRPGDAPLRRLGECLEIGATAAPDGLAVAAWAARHPGARLVIFIDQLEELFTQAAGDQAGFAAALGALHGEPRCLVVLALRADFYAELMQSPLWYDRCVDLPPLRGAALRAAIEQPARAQGVYFEPGLIDRLLADAAAEPGVLPLLQETLVQLWGHRRERLLTLTAYEALGEGGHSGLAVAISSRADRCLRAMTPGQELIAQRLLLRLVSFGEGRPDTRRRQTRAQLAAGEPPAEFDAVLQQLVAARLVTMDGDAGLPDPQVDLCHEVLITAWPAFAAWVAARRADEQRRRQIQASAEEWIARGRGASGLLDAGELAAAIAWRMTTAARELGESPEVTALIEASRDALDRARWRRRRWLATAFAALALFAAVTAALAIAARRQAAEAERQRGEAERQRADAETQRRAAVRMLGEQYRESGRQLVVAGHFQRAIPYLVAARDQGIDDAALRALFHTATASSVRIALRHDGPVAAVAFSDDGARVVTGSADGTARVWDAATGAPLTPPLHHARPVDIAKIRGDGTRILTVTDDHAVRIWEVTASPPPPIELRHADKINAAEFSADGTLVVTASDDRTARLWSVATGQPVIPPLAHDARVTGVAISPDGTRIATTVNESHETTLTQERTGVAVTVSNPRGAALWNARTGARIADLEEDPVTSARSLSTRAHASLATSATFSADSRRMVTTGTDRVALVWDATTGKTILPPLRHDIEVASAAFRSDGKQIATVDVQGQVRLWDAATGAAAKIAIDASAIARVTYSRDGARLLGAGGDKRVRIWDAASGSQVAALELESGMMDVAISGDGAQVATASADGLARIWSIRPAMRVLEVVERAYDAAYSPDGSRIATTRSGGPVRLWTASGQLVAERHPNLGTSEVVFDPRGAQLAAVGLDGSAEIGDAATATLRPFRRVLGKNPTGAPDSPDRIIGHLLPRGAFSPDGRRFATTAGARRAGIWDIASGEPVTPPLSHDGSVLMVRWSPDGRRVITASEDATARMWDAATGAPIGAPLAHPADTWVTAALFTPDGKRVVTLCTDSNARLWDAASGKLQAVLSGHAGYLIAAEISPDGTRLLTHSDDHSARLWDLATGKLAIPPLEHGDWVGGAAFSPDGARMVTAAGPLVQVWDVRTGLPLGPPFVHADIARTAMFSPDGNSVLTVGLTAFEIWDAGLDTGSLDEWHRLARDSSFPQLGQTLDRTLDRARSGPRDQ